MSAGSNTERVFRMLAIHETAEPDLIAVVCDLTVSEAELALQALIQRNRVERVAGTGKYRLKLGPVA